MTKKINRTQKPKEGDTVFLIGAKKYLAMQLKKILIEEGKEYGCCIWDAITMKNGELIYEPCSNTYLLSLLTTEAPPVPTSIYPG